MKRLLLFLLFASPARAQFAVPAYRPNSSAGGGASTYTFSQTTFVAENSSTVASITSPAITVTAGDVAIVWCRSQLSTVTSITASDSTSSFYTALTFRSASSPGAAQGSYSLSLGGGSTTFKCTPNVSVAFQAMIVLVYHHSGSAATFDTQTGNTPVSVTTATSPSFTTSAASLIVMCGTINGATTFTAGSIGANTATVRGIAGASGSTDGVCEDTQFGSNQTSITASVTSAVSLNWVESVVSLK